MSVVALFRGKWGHKSQEASDKRQVVGTVQSSHEDDDDEDEATTGFQREPIRRNSRFYRSMRKKRISSSDQSESSPVASLDRSPLSAKAGLSSLNSLNTQKSPLLPGSRRHPPSPQLHYSRVVLPGDGEARRVRSNRNAMDIGKGGGGGVGGRSRVDAPASLSSQRRDFPAEMISYRTHGIHCSDVQQLCEQMASTGTVHEIRARSMDSAEPGSDGTDSLRLQRKEESSPVNHSLKIIQNVGFLYQEYRDTSEQQQIERRRQQENHCKPVTVGASGGAPSPLVMQLQLRNNTQQLTLWQNLQAVQNSGLLNQLSQDEIIMQEVMFELVTSEASYYKSLEILETHFLRNPILINTLIQSDLHFLFSNIEEVMAASERFLMDLEHRMEESVLISDVCDIVYEHAVKHFSVFIKYVINQAYQEKNYRRILEENIAFRDKLTSLENHPRVRGLSFTSFLILPFQRITRLKLLVQNILKKAEENSEMEANAIKAHQELEKIVKECNEGVRKMSRTEELISIEKTLEFKSKSVPIISHSRWLLKKGEVQLMAGPKSTRTMRSRKLHQPVYLFLFNNLLLVTKRSGEKFQVLDSCSRAMLRTEDLEDQGQQLAGVFSLKMLENQDDREVIYMIKTTSMSEKLRWIFALTPNRRTRFLSTSSHQPDSPQVQCIQSYSAQEPDELSIEMADVLNLLDQTNDGWMMGERLHDGERGWFPSRVAEEIQSKELRAQNLKEAFRIQLAYDVGAGSHSGAKMGLRGGRRTAKGLNVSGSCKEQMGDHN
ncbi:ephexin-1-like isoform X1 [Cololabis saira]|uniref:ephexin-1-like isoform X1 n=1 Tax=Cololabis saira TaxID=129043 RepID=UPI002AD5622C|nr:ephexin-1-like isoform X1 [Cololabis saira]